MKVYLKTGEVLDVVGDMPVVQPDGFVRFDAKCNEVQRIGIIISYPTNDPLVPFDNIAYIEH